MLKNFVHEQICSVRYVFPLFLLLCGLYGASLSVLYQTLGLNLVVSLSNWGTLSLDGLHGSGGKSSIAILDVFDNAHEYSLISAVTRFFSSYETHLCAHMCS